MGEIKNKGRVPGFWQRNWLSLTVISMLSWGGTAYWQTIVRLSPYLIVVYAFLLYLFVVKLLFDNRLVCDRLFTELREGGWILIKAVVSPGIAIWQKFAAGMDLLTQRLEVEQELIIAEKRKRKLEIELSQRELQELLAQMPHPAVTPPALSVMSESPAEHNPEKSSSPTTVPPYARYAPILMDYLEQVRWERFTVTQAQLILHKRFGTVKLVLEELVQQRKLEYVKMGKRVAYRPVTNDNK